MPEIRVIPNPNFTISGAICANTTEILFGPGELSTKELEHARLTAHWQFKELVWIARTMQTRQCKYAEAIRILAKKEGTGSVTQ